MMKSSNADEDAKQLALLTTPTGAPGSGRVRYAAAMYFYQEGRLGARALEVYRSCSPIDGEDPRATLERLGLTEATALAGPDLIRATQPK